MALWIGFAKPSVIILFIMFVRLLYVFILSCTPSKHWARMIAYVALLASSHCKHLEFQFLCIVFHFPIITMVALSAGSVDSSSGSKPRFLGSRALINYPPLDTDLVTYFLIRFIVELNAFKCLCWMLNTTCSSPSMRPLNLIQCLWFSLLQLVQSLLVSCCWSSTWSLLRINCGGWPGIISVCNYVPLLSLFNLLLPYHFCQ